RVSRVRAECDVRGRVRTRLPRLRPGAADAEVMLAVGDRDGLTGRVERDGDELPVALVKLPGGGLRAGVPPRVARVEPPVLEDPRVRRGGRIRSRPDASVDDGGAPGHRTHTGDVTGGGVDRRVAPKQVEPQRLR